MYARKITSNLFALVDFLIIAEMKILHSLGSVFSNR